jgi:hypothetical protein
MNNAVVVSDSISPSTQTANAQRQGYTAETSFADTLDEVMNEVSEAEKSSTENDGYIKEQAEELVSQLVTMESILQELKGTLSGFFDANGLPKDPPVELGYDAVSDEITVKGDREDTDRIAELINGDSELKEELKASLDKAQMLVTIADNIFKYKDYMDSLEEPPPTVGLIYGTKTSVTTDRPLGAAQEIYEAADAEAAESEELNKLFEKIKELMLMVFLQLDPEEEEEKKTRAAARDDNGASEEAADDVDENADETDALTSYQQLMLSIERTRAAAIFNHGTDKNKYAMAIESYSMKMYREEEAENKNSLNNIDTEDAEDASDSVVKSA